MNWATSFREIVSGRQTGIGPAVVRSALSGAELPYTWAVRWRNRRYDRGKATIHRVAVPVISVGNLTLGGTGKTPMVQWIVRWLCGRGIPVAIVSRGYGAQRGQKNDEARELGQSLPDVPHVQHRDRVAAATAAIATTSAQVIVADDAFQHRRLARDLDLVLIDALEPFGFGHVFPRGTLREPLEGLRRAAIVCLTRADMVDERQRRAIEAEVRNIHPDVAWCEVAHQPCELLSASGERVSCTSLVDQPVAAFCGIGNPVAFHHTLTRIGCRIVGWREYPDHHSYTSDDLDSLRTFVSESGAALAACTHKDLVKLGIDRLEGIPLWAVRVEMDVRRGSEHLESALEQIAAKVRTERFGRNVG